MFEPHETEHIRLLKMLTFLPDHLFTLLGQCVCHTSYIHQHTLGKLRIGTLILCTQESHNYDFSCEEKKGKEEDLWFV